MTEEHTIRASDEEYEQYIVHYEDIPQEELAPGSWSHLVAGKEAVVSFLTIPAGTYFSCAPTRGGADHDRGGWVYRSGNRRQDVSGKRR